jgi:hypothetical protein
VYIQNVYYFKNKCQKVWNDTKSVLSLHCQENYQNTLISTPTKIYDMKTNSLLADAQNFAQIIANETNQKTRIELCVSKRKELAARLNSAAGVRRYLTEYRLAIKAHTQITKKIALLKSLRISRASNQKIQKKYKVNVEKRAERNEFTIIKSSVIAPLIQKASELLSSGMRYKVAAGLLLLTGRRTAEIFLTGNFAPATKSNKVEFSGQVKKRDAENIAKSKAYKIPVLIDSSKIIDANNWLKNQYNGLNIAPKSKTPTPIFADIADVNKRISKDLGKTIKIEFSEFLGADVTPHDLRKAYAAITYFLNSEKYKDLNSFREHAKNVLGHSDTGANSTTETYIKYKII